MRAINCPLSNFSKSGGDTGNDQRPKGLLGWLHSCLRFVLLYWVKANALQCLHNAVECVLSMSHRQLTAYQIEFHCANLGQGSELATDKLLFSGTVHLGNDKYAADMARVFICRTGWRRLRMGYATFSFARFHRCSNNAWPLPRFKSLPRW